MNVSYFWLILCAVISVSFAAEGREAPCRRWKTRLRCNSKDAEARRACGRRNTRREEEMMASVAACEARKRSEANRGQGFFAAEGEGDQVIFDEVYVKSILGPLSEEELVEYAHLANAIKTSDATIEQSVSEPEVQANLKLILNQE